MKHAQRPNFIELGTESDFVFQATVDGADYLFVKPGLGEGELEIAVVCPANMLHWVGTSLQELPEYPSSIFHTQSTTQWSLKQSLPELSTTLYIGLFTISNQCRVTSKLV